MMHDMNGSMMNGPIMWVMAGYHLIALAAFVLVIAAAIKYLRN